MQIVKINIENINYSLKFAENAKKYLVRSDQCCREGIQPLLRPGAAEKVKDCSQFELNRVRRSFTTSSTLW